MLPCVEIQCNGKRGNCGHQDMKQQEAPGLHKADVGRSWERRLPDFCLTTPIGGRGKGKHDHAPPAGSARKCGRLSLASLATGAEGCFRRA